MWLCGRRVIAVILFLLVWSLPATTSELPKRFLSQRNGTDSDDCLNDSTGDFPCKTLHYALVNRNISGSSLHLFVHPGEYEYGSAELKVQGFVNLSISKVSESDESVIFRCESFNDTTYMNLAIYDGQTFSVNGIIFQECGIRGAALYINNTADVSVLNCTFRNNTGTGLIFYRSQTIQIKNCTFRDNIGLSANLGLRDRPNFYIRSSGGLAVILDSTWNVTANISDCNFINNTAGVTPEQRKDPRPHPYVTVGSGGGLTVRIREAQNARVYVMNCRFSENVANYSGGGIYVPFIEQSRNNSILISDSTFIESYAGEYGGGIFVDVFDVNENNSVIVRNSVFRSSYARFCGGGVGAFQEDTLVAPSSSYSKNILVIINCTFDKNTALDGGSAVGAVSRQRVDQPLLITYFKNCTFTNNNATVDGTVLLIRFGAIFEGMNIFIGNTGEGIVLVLARMDARGRLWFQRNTADDGAGISMQDRCLINLHSDTNITFLDNKARSVGGALQLQRAKPGDDMHLSSLFNTFCFIQYQVEKDNRSLTPRQWHERGNVTVSFLNNMAGHAGAAMYTSDLRECSFTVANATCEDDSGNLTVYHRSIFPGPPFFFSNNTVIGGLLVDDETIDDVATDPDSLTVKIEPSLKAAPGDKITFVIELFDQSGNRREGIWSFSRSEVRRANITHKNMEDTVVYYGVSNVAPKRHEVTVEAVLYPQDTCNYNDTVVDKKIGEQQVFKFFTIDAQSGEVILTKEDVVVDITCCHPGYYYNGTCELQPSYPHFLRSDQSNRYIYLEPSYYAGFYSDASTGQSYLTVALMPAVFQNCNPEGNRIGCLYEYDSPDKQCVSGRSGYMCGKCLRTNQGVDMTLRACKTCNAGDTVILTIICVLIVVLSAAVLVFNIGLPNDLKGFLFYAQVVGFAYLNGAQNSSWDFHSSRFLGFSLYLPICPFTSLSALWTAAFGFLPSILTTFTVIGYIICARFIKPLSQRTAFSGIWLLFLLVYKFTADTTANILKCVQVESAGSRKYLAFYYDGSVQCFAGQHLILAIPSLILFVVVVALGPAFVILISFKRYRITQPFTDVITKGIKTECRWWSGFDLLRRLLFIVVVTVFDFLLPAYTQLALCFSTLIILAVHCATKPYEKTWINYVEGLILLDLLLISIRFLNEEEFRNPTSADIFNHSSIAYLLFPFVYAFVNITIRIIYMLWTKYMPMNAAKIMEYITQWLKPQNAKGKPLLKGQKSFDLPEPAQTRYSSEAYGDMEDTVAIIDEGQHADVDYSALREELLESYNN